ncbi:MAG TPA: hypothetical protein VJS44_21575 [Pyrinomonadaceae bacterium]|nr:hypothetical protein [Pyrinomonadaceae bacterium]
MRFNLGKKLLLLLAVLALSLLATDSVSTAPPPAPLAPPNPVLVYAGQEYYETGGKQWTRYKYSVFNMAEYPNEMFAAAPELPPCGTNTKSSRTWVDIYTQAGKRLYGFCTLANRDGLGRLWFALERNDVPPSWVYIELNDRKTNTKYKSNLAETTD